MNLKQIKMNVFLIKWFGCVQPECLNVRCRFRGFKSNGRVKKSLIGDINKNTSSFNIKQILLRKNKIKYTYSLEFRKPEKLKLSITERCFNINPYSP